MKNTQAVFIYIAIAVFVFYNLGTFIPNNFVAGMNYRLDLLASFSIKTANNYCF